MKLLLAVALALMPSAAAAVPVTYSCQLIDGRRDTGMYGDVDQVVIDTENPLIDLRVARTMGTTAEVNWIFTTRTGYDGSEEKMSMSRTRDGALLFIILMLGTAARNEAITSLAWPQVDFDEGLVQLNPDGRKQTSKRRPTVRLLPSVRAALEPLDRRTPAVLMFRGEKVIKVRKGWDRAVARAELDDAVTPYSCRHTAAKWMRKEGVSPWDTAAQLGHRMQGFSMTEQYARFSPDYLAAPAAALEKLICRAVPLDAPKVPSGR